MASFEFSVCVTSENIVTRKKKKDLCVIIGISKIVSRPLFDILSYLASNEEFCFDGFLKFFLLDEEKYFNQQVRQDRSITT